MLVSELGQAVGYQDLPVEDGDDCEADDNTLNIEPAKKLGWEPQLNVLDYVTAQKELYHQTMTINEELHS